MLLEKYKLKTILKTYTTWITPSILFGLLLSLTSCGLKAPSWGEMDDIYVFADRNLYNLCEKDIAASLGRIIDTPQHEPVFNVIYKDFLEFSDYYRNPNILMLAALEDSGEVSDYVRRMLDSATLQGVRDGVYWIFNKKNPWFSDQNLVIAIANDSGELSARINFGTEDLFMTFHSVFIEQLKHDLYAKMEQKKLSEELQEKYGFNIRIQHDYYVTYESNEDRLIRMNRVHPNRWLSISWSESPVDSLTEEIVVAERMRTSKLFADPSLIYPEYNTFETGFDGIPGSLFLRGLWGTEANIGGGPFFTYAVRDDSSGVVYFIDGSVFAPEYRKMPFIKQLEIMAGTFTPPYLIEE